MNIDRVEILPDDNYYISSIDQKHDLETFKNIDNFQQALNYFKQNIVLTVFFKDIFGDDFPNIYRLWDGSIVTPFGKYVAYIKDHMSGTGVIFFPKKNCFRGPFNNLQKFLSKMYLTYSEYKANTSGKLTTSVEGLKLAKQLEDWLNSMFNDEV